jgi:hypothetical protein
MTTDRIKEIQKQIIVKLEAGEDVSELTQRLAQERAKIAAQAEVEELEKIAAGRQALWDQAAKVQEKARLQGEAIDTFLKLRDTLVSQLQPLLKPMSELVKMAAASWEREPGVCYIFNDIGQFAATVRQIPKGYFPADFGCAFLEMAGGKEDARDKARKAHAFLMWALGILTDFQKGISHLPLRPDGEFDGELEIESELKPGTSEVETNCRICQHPEREAIDKALRADRSLRDIETEFNVSRSTLSRHKNRCLNLGTAKARE